MRQASAAEFRQRQEEIPVGVFGVAQAAPAAAMLMALCFASLLLFTGQISTHNVQPVQSSGDTCNGIAHALDGLAEFGLADLKLAGASASAARLVQLRADHGVRAHQHAFSALDAQILVPDRNLLCDVALLPLRRSGRERPVDRHRADRQRVAPSRRSPSPKRCARNAGAVAATGGSMSNEAFACVANGTSCKSRQRSIDGREILFHGGGAALAVGVLDRLLDRGDRLSRGSTPLMAKKQTCMIVLMRRPMPASRATETASMTKTRSLLSIIVCCTCRGRLIPHLIRAIWRVEQNRRAGIGRRQHVDTDRGTRNGGTRRNSPC